ncbi:DUF4259 domain-containing protein [Corynebacterium pacaense]|uniref:DUF4259 domain-containing protein n=1 Tax=Corynebacterium pacaense TaxID=1816684 RepID=UPI0009B9B06D|nr:DUF4259 domain-containing protein [Corynebacterium pacaense]
MKIWNTGPFDNEEAQEVLRDLRNDELLLEELLPDAGHRYIEEDQGAMIIALAHLAAGNQPQGAAVPGVDKLRTPELRDRLRQCLEAVLIDASVSGLYARWETEGEALHEWKARSHVRLSDL